jgi:hypothetical protein
MDFETLLQPYSDEGNRTLQGQIDWLVNKKQIDVNLAQLAIAKVYFEISGGLTFSKDEHHSAGWHLDQYLLQTAIKLKQDALAQIVKVAGDKLQQLIASAIVENRKVEQAPKLIEKSPPKLPWYRRLL